MELNYEKKYAYAELEEILNWLGSEYINKLPRRILQVIKYEKKQSYKPQIDFSKPLENQVRQETKNMIAYLNCKYWLQDEEEKSKIKSSIRKNYEKKKEMERAKRREEIRQRAEEFGKKNYFTSS